METPKQSQRNEKMAHNVWSKAPQQKKYHGKGEGKGLPSKKQRKYVTDHDLKREIKRKMEANVTKGEHDVRLHAQMAQIFYINVPV